MMMWVAVLAASDQYVFGRLAVAMRARAILKIFWIARSAWKAWLEYGEEKVWDMLEEASSWRKGVLV